ncbi:MAK10-like protein [Tanacetum coccineum]
MGDANPIHTLEDYSKPIREGYRNTIELPVGKNVVPFQSDTIRLVQNGCSFHGLRSEDPNQYLKDFLKLVDSLDLDDENRERTRLRSITAWEDLTTHFLAQFFPSGRTVKLHNDILMFQQHHRESLSEAWTCFKDLLQKVPHYGIDLWLQLRDRNAKESWALLEDLALYDNEIWNDPRDFAKPVKEIALPQDVQTPKRIHFINSIVILSKESEAEEGETTTDITPEHGHNITKEARGEVKEVMEEDKSKVETDWEVEEILEEEEEDEDGEYFNSFPTMEELTHHNWLLRNPRPLWVKARIRAGSLNNIKISCMIGHFFKRHAYIDLESPINVMSRHLYNRIMTYGLESRVKPSNPNKISNFVGRVRSLKIFIGSFTYECDFMILEDTTSIIDRHLGEMAFGRPFIDEISLVYNKEKGTIMFK